MKRRVDRKVVRKGKLYLNSSGMIPEAPIRVVKIEIGSKLIELLERIEDCLICGSSQSAAVAFSCVVKVVELV